MLANIFILVFVLAMVYWWSLQGAFSAFIHLMIVVIAGSLAFAFWEPLVHAFGMKMQPQYAWGLWLLGPFILLLIGLRLATDRLVKKNMQFQPLVGKIIGGAFGAASGILTAGVVVLGLSFLPLPSSLGGYEPYVISATGQVGHAGGGGLWLPVDRVASRFFATAAYNGFYHSTPLPEYQPDLVEAANLYRLRYDENGSVIAVVGSVTVPRVAAAPAPIEQLDATAALPLAEVSGQRSQQGGQQVIAVDTAWQQTPGTYDSDNALRVPPMQVRLLAQRQGVTGQPPHIHAPVGVSKDTGKGRLFIPIRNLDAVAFGNRQTETFAWVFVLPSDQNPLFLRVRNLRLELPTVTRDPATVAAMIGLPERSEAEAAEEPAAAAAAPSTVGGREGIMAGNVADQIELSAMLPRQVSANGLTGVQVQNGAIDEGRATASKPPASLSQNTRVDRVLIPSHQGGVRLRILPDRARSLLGGARVAAASLQGVWIVDDRGDRYQPIGYVWFKPQSGEQEISINRNQPIQSARQLPIQQLADDHELYLYFAVPKGSKIVSYHIGDSTSQEITPPLAVN